MKLLVFFFVVATLFSNPSFATSSVLDALNPQNPTVKTAMGILSQEKEVRILVPTGGGMGHQRSTLSLMIRLHQLGFQGTYRIFSAPDAVKRLRSLISDNHRVFSFFPEERIHFEFENDLSSREFEEAVKDLKPIKYGFWAANDFTYMTSKMARVETLIQLQPTDWPGERYVENGEGKRELGQSDVLWDLNTLSPLLSILEKTIEAGPKKESLTQILKAMDEGKVDVQVIYGLKPWPHFSGVNYVSEEDSGLTPQEELKLLLGGLQKIQGELKRPLYLFVLESLSNDVLLEFNSPEKKIEVISDLSQSLSQIYDPSRLKAGDIRVVNVGGLPQPLFDSLLENSTLPPIIEGANARAVVKATRGTFIPGGRHYILDDPAQEKAKEEFQKEHDLFEAIRRALCTRLEKTNQNEITLRENAIAAFYHAYLSHEMDGYFSSWHQHFLERPDAVLNALSHIPEVGK